MLTVKSFEFSPVQENTYVLFNEEKLCCIIDPGCYFNHEKKELKDFINQYDLQTNLLLNTHCHLDHVFGNKFVFETFNTILHIHEKEKQVLDYAPLFGKNWNLPFENYNAQIAYLKEGDTVFLGKDRLKVLFAPGHSPGHICFYNETQGFVIGGDVLFRLGIGRTDLPGGNHATLLASIRRELLTLPDETIVYPGHGEQTTVGYERLNNPFLQ